MEYFIKPENYVRVMQGIGFYGAVIFPTQICKKNLLLGPMPQPIH